MSDLKPLHPLQTDPTPQPSVASPEPTIPEVSKTTQPKLRRELPKFIKPLLLVLLVVVVVLGAFGAVGAYAASQMIPPMQQTVQYVRETMASIQNKNLVEAKAKLKLTKDSLVVTQGRYSRFAFFKLVPVISSYYSDGQSGLEAANLSIQAGEILVESIEPYADLLGLQVGTSSALPKTESAEDRIVFLVNTLDAISPKLDDISKKLSEADVELKKINPNRYPKEIKGKKIREKIILAQSSLDSAAKSLSEAKPLIALLPQLLGQDKEKTYMLLFQNDAEIRPTGGFMTAYAYLKVNKGKITPLDSYDIYDLDARWNKKLPAPEPIKKYLPLVNNWNLRDMNLSPDLKVSLDTFMENYRDVPNTLTVDGVIAMDTHLPVEILKVIGPIGVGGWGNFSSENDPRCDCPQVVYVLEDTITRPVNTFREDRKAVLGPLMHSLMANAMGSPKSLWPQLLNVAISAMKEKHVMFYFPDEANQKLAEAMNAAGRIVESEGDYLHINDSNFGGAKSNLFITEKVEEEIEFGDDGSVSKTVSILYDNPHVASNCNLEAGKLCLNGVYRDWVRLYVPQGATLTEVVGSEVEAKTSTDLGKTVFEVFFTMRPQSSSKLVFKYKLPGTYKTPYHYLIQKQPGKDTYTHEISFNGKPYTLEIAGDTTVDLD